MSVFVPVLLGAGLIASGVAWLVERIARLTSRAGTTSSLSKDLAGLAPPEGGFLGGDDPLELLQRPRIEVIGGAQEPIVILVVAVLGVG